MTTGVHYIAFYLARDLFLSQIALFDSVFEHFTCFTLLALPNVPVATFSCYTCVMYISVLQPVSSTACPKSDCKQPSEQYSLLATFVCLP